MTLSSRCALLLAISYAVVAPVASADEGLAVGFERAFGLSSASVTAEGPNDSSTTNTTTNFGLGLASQSGVMGLGRVGIDYIMDNQLSLGGAIGVSTSGGDTETKAAGITINTESPSATSFVLAPRVGYVLSLSDKLSLWPRGGFTYAHVGVDAPNGDAVLSASEIALSLEVPLLFMPHGGVGFTLSPTLDWGLSYSVEQNGTDADGDYSALDLGLHFGIVAFL